MNTYDPADRILYVHLAQEPAATPRSHGECHRLPVGYANVSLRARLDDAWVASARPALTLLRGGSAADDSAPAAPPLRLAQ